MGLDYFPAQYNKNKGFKSDSQLINKNFNIVHYSFTFASMTVTTQEIDLVYLWVDGEDPIWKVKKSRFTELVYDNSETHNKGRYTDNDELKYALRSAHQYAPWIRRIFIVTDNQRPKWLDTSHPKITVVDHREIFPEDALPCYNSSVIEYFLYKIPGLSERFLYANDDMFFNAPLSPAFFFAEVDGFPIVRMKKNLLDIWLYPLKRMTKKGVGQYAETVRRGATMVKERFGKYYAGTPHHNIDAYLKSDYKKAVEDVFKEEILASQFNRTRSRNDVQRSTFSLYALSQGRAHLKYVGRRTSSRILLNKHDFRAYLEKYHPKLFCLNDSQRITDAHRSSIGELLQQQFPQKSPFEL